MFGINQRFQRRAITRLCEVPRGIRCPCCHHDFDIVVSRRQVEGNFLSRNLLRYYRCRTCDNLFRTFDISLTAIGAFRWSIPLAAIAVIGLLIVRL